LRDRKQRSAQLTDNTLLKSRAGGNRIVEPIEDALALK